MGRDQGHGITGMSPGGYTTAGPDAILTLLNVIIYSGNPTAHVLSGPPQFTLVNYMFIPAKTAARKSNPASASRILPGVVVHLPICAARPVIEDRHLGP